MKKLLAVLLVIVLVLSFAGCGTKTPDKKDFDYLSILISNQDLTDKEIEKEAKKIGFDSLEEAKEALIKSGKLIKLPAFTYKTDDGIPSSYEGGITTTGTIIYDYAVKNGIIKWTN